MEAQDWQIKREEVFSMHPGFILSLKVFNQGKAMLTFGSNGQINIYSRSKNEWVHRNSNKLYDCSIIANDVKQRLGVYEIVMVGYDGNIKVAKLTTQFELVIIHQFKFKFEELLISCVWSNKSNQVILTSESKKFFVLNLPQQNCSQIKLGETQAIDMMRVRRGCNGVYVNSCEPEKGIYEIIYDGIELLDIRLVFQVKRVKILDFLVSDQQIYWTLAILTEDKLMFILVSEEQAAQTSTFSLTDTSICSKLGWGRNFSELGLYQCIDGLIKTRYFVKKTTGCWQEDIILSVEPAPVS